VYRAMTAWCRVMAEGESEESAREIASSVDAAINCGAAGDGAQADSWADFYQGVAFLFRAVGYAKEQNHLESLQWAKRGLGRIARASHSVVTAADASVLIGAYQYFTDYAPWYVRFFASLFIMPTDKNRGIESMAYGMRKAVFLKPEACMLLTVAYAWEHDPDRALELATTLGRSFPANHQLGALRQYALMHSGRFDDAFSSATNDLERIESDGRAYNRGLLADQHYALGTIAVCMTNYQQALTHFSAAHAMGGAKPRVKAWAILRQGTVYDLLGQRASACQCYTAARVIKADTPMVRSYADLFLKHAYAGEALE
jgi:tetratricopeptide (TPR) repeat protein